MPRLGNHTLFGRVRFGSYARLGAAGVGSPKLASGSFSARGYYLLNGGAAKVLYPGGTILANLGTFIRGVDVASQAIKDAAESAFASWNIKVYLQDASASPKWMDITDRTEWRGRNQVLSIGRLQYSGERRVGALQQRMSNLVVTNEDGFWSRPWAETSGGFTHKLLATYDSSWNFLDDSITAVGATPSAASSNADTRWHLSTNGEQTALYHHKVAIRVEYEVKGGIPEYATMGVFIVEAVSCDSESETASITLAPLTKPLTEGNKAEAVKEGAGWYRNRPPKFLVERLLKEEYADNDYGLPSSWEIENVIEYKVPLEGKDSWVASNTGRPPERVVDATTANGRDNSSVWISDPVKIPHSVCLWEYGNNSDTLGTVSITPGTDIVTGSGTEWVNGDQPPQVGDSFVIPKEFTSGDQGSVYGGDGKYTIVSIASDISIVLDKTTNGSQAESGLIYSIPRLYIGTGNELYEYNMTTDIYYKLGEMSDSNMYIDRIWANPKDSDYPIWGVALSPMGEHSGDVNESMRIFRFSWDGDDPNFDEWGSGTAISIFSGQWTIRDSDWGEGPSNTYNSFIGQFTSGVDHPPLAIPFQQIIANQRDTCYDSLDTIKNEALRSTVSRGFEEDGSSSWDSISPEIKEIGFHSVRNRSFTVQSTAYSTRNFAVRYSSGQSGFIVFQPLYGNNGAIFYAKSSDLISGGDPSSSDNTSYEFTYSYYLIDLNQADPGSGTPTSSSPLPDLGNVEGSYDFSKYAPTCGCASLLGDSVYIGCSRFTQSYMDEDPAFSAILEASEQVSGAFAWIQKFGSTTQQDNENYIFLDMAVFSNSNLYVSCLHLDEFPTGSASYKLFGMPALNQSGTITTIASSNSMFQGLCKMDIGVGSPSEKIIAHSLAQSKITMYDNTLAVQDGTTLSLGEAVFGDQAVYRNQISSSDNIKELYWISSPVPFFPRDSMAYGRFYLCRYSPLYPARIPLADFSGMSIWDSISAIADLTDSRFGFRPDGNFYYKQRPKSTSSVYTFTNVSSSRFLSASIKSGEEDIINEAIRRPLYERLGEIQVTLRVKSDSKAANISLDARQRTERAVKIKLYCINGGKINDATWAYTTLRGITNTYLRENYISDSWSINIEDVEDVVYGSNITVRGVDSSDDEKDDTAIAGYSIKYNSTQLVTSKDIEDSTNELTVDSGVFPDLTEAPMGNAHNLSIGDILLLGNIGDEDNYEYVHVVGIESAKIYIARGIGGLYKPISHGTGTSIYLIRNGHQVFTKSVLSSDTDYLAGDKVTITHPDEDAWSQSLTIDPGDVSNTNLSSETSWQGKDEAFVPIGGYNKPHATGICLSLTWVDPEDGTKESKNKFSVGDLITITSPGLELVEDNASLRVYSDLKSQAMYKKRANDSKNKFLDAKQAYWKVRQVVQDYAYPHYRFTVDSILTPWIMPLDVVKIQHPALLPMADEKTVACYVTSISFDLQNQGLETIEMRAVNPY